MNAMRLDILGLEAFVAVALRSSFQRAATHLGLTQTALSHRVKKLETNLGVDLLARTTRRVMLTSAGLELLPKAQALLADANRMLADIRVNSSDRRREIALGCLPTLTITVLPQVLERFFVRNPKVKVRIYDNSASEIQEHVLKGDAEFAITSAGPARQGLEFTELLDEPYVVICPKKHSLGARRSVRWSDVADLPLVRISERTGNRQLIDEALGLDADRLNWVAEVQHIASAVAIVAAGSALTIVPRMAIDATRVPDLVLLPLRDPPVSRTLGTLVRAGHVLSPDAAALMQDTAVYLRRRLATKSR